MRKHIYVVAHGTQWQVKCDHCTAVTTHTTQSAAIQEARSHVGRLAAGTLAEIRVQGVGGQFRTEWTYGKDPFPPRG
jgi:hypothetical protein